MKARILVVRCHDGSEEYFETPTIADHYTMDNNPSWLPKMAEEVKARIGSEYVTHGFIDVEIPDSAIEAVTRQHVDAGVVDAQEVEP